MSTIQTERINFATSRYMAMSRIGTTDGTTNEQAIGGAAPWYCVNSPTQTLAYCEPEKQHIEGNEDLTLDRMTRLVILPARSGGTGAWTGKIRLSRSGSANNVQDISFTIPLTNAPVPIVIDDPLDVDCMKSTNGGEALTDFFFAHLLVTPGQAAAADVSVFAFLMPGFVVGDSNKGANVSARHYLKI